MSDRIDAEITRQCIAMHAKDRNPAVLYVGPDEMRRIYIKVYGEAAGVVVPENPITQYRGLNVVCAEKRGLVHVTEARS